MLFTEDSLMTGVNGLSILDESYYVDSEVATPTTVPVVENSELGAAIVRFSDIESISESYGCDFIDAMEAVAEQNEIDPEYLAVAVDEARIIEEPELIYELANVVINPQSENSLAYQFCEACLDNYIDSEGDETFLEAIIDEDVAYTVLNELFDVDGTPMTVKQMLEKYGSKGAYVQAKNKLRTADTGFNANRAHSNFQPTKKTIAGINATKKAQRDAYDNAQKEKLERTKAYAQDGFKRAKAEINKPGLLTRAGNLLKNNKGKVAAGVGAAAVAGLAYKNRDRIKSALGGAASSSKLDKIVAAANSKPKSWISQKIAALRGMYSKWLQKAQAESDAGKASVIKKFAAKILACIDALMKKLENATA